MQLVIFGLFVFCLQWAHYCDPWKPNYSSLLLWHFAFKKAVKAACSAGGLCLDRSVPQEKLATAQTLIWLWERAIVLKSTFELFHKPESKIWWSVPTSFRVFFFFTGQSQLTTWLAENRAPILSERKRGFQKEIVCSARFFGIWRISWSVSHVSAMNSRVSWTGMSKFSSIYQMWHLRQCWNY